MHAPLQVKWFADDILWAAAQRTNNTEDVPIQNMAAVFFLSSLAGYFTGKLGFLKNAGIGAGSFAAGKTIDLLSTIKSFETNGDPRITEYGLDHYFSEANDSFSHFPTREELIQKGSAQVFATLFMGFFLPSLGRGYLGISPIIATNNIKNGNTVSEAMRIGDQVKSMIAKGADKETIKNYLASLY